MGLFFIQVPELCLLLNTETWGNLLKVSSRKLADHKKKHVFHGTYPLILMPLPQVPASFI